MKLPFAMALLVLALFGERRSFAVDAPVSIPLEAKDAKIEGPGARFDGRPEFRCIRYWSTSNVVVRWKCDLPAKGAYRVFLTYACPASQAGTEVEVKVGGQAIRTKTASSGSWTIFKEFDQGPILLRKAGPTELSVQALGSQRAGIWDLRGVRLVRED